MKADAGNQRDAAELTATHWSVVLQAGSAQTALRAEALETLCRTYWYPLYCFARRLGSDAEDAQDLTQSFFAVFLEKNYVNRADPERGRFRTFLLTSFRNFLTNEWKRARTARRGGGCQLLHLDTAGAEDRYLQDRAQPAAPERTFDKSWAVSTLERAMSQVREEYAAAGKAGLYDNLKLRLWGDTPQTPNAELAQRLRLSEAALKMATTRLRQRFRHALRQEVARTVADPEELDDEVRYLFSVLQD